MRTKRCIHDVIYDLLETLQVEGMMIKTGLCTAVNLPLDRCSKLINLLLEYGLIYMVEEDGKTYYSITENGYVYTSLYKQLNTILPLRSQNVS